MNNLGNQDSTATLILGHSTSAAICTSRCFPLFSFRRGQTGTLRAEGSTTCILQEPLPSSTTWICSQRFWELLSLASQAFICFSRGLEENELSQPGVCVLAVMKHLQHNMSTPRLYSPPPPTWSSQSLPLLCQVNSILLGAQVGKLAVILGASLALALISNLLPIYLRYIIRMQNSGPNQPDSYMVL